MASSPSILSYALTCPGLRAGVRPFASLPRSFIRGDHFASLPRSSSGASVAQHFHAYEGQPLTIPAEAAGPKPEYLAWHRAELFGKGD